MTKLTKKVFVGGKEMVLSSMDGRAWFLKTESMHDFEKRLRQDAKDMAGEFEDFPMEMVRDDRRPLQMA